MRACIFPLILGSFVYGTNLIYICCFNLICLCTYFSDDSEKSTVSHMVFMCSKQHMCNTKKRRPNREHRSDAGQVPSEGQVRTSHNSKVLERGQLCVSWLVRVLELLQQQKVDIFSLNQKSFPYRSPNERILRNPFLVGILLSMGHKIFPYTYMRGGQAKLMLEPSTS